MIWIMMHAVTLFPEPSLYYKSIWILIQLNPKEGISYINAHTHIYGILMKNIWLIKRLSMENLRKERINKQLINKLS